MVVLKELTFYQFATLVVCGGQERTDVITICYLWAVWGGHDRIDFLPVANVGSLLWSWKNWFLTVSNLGVCGGLDRADFLPFATLVGLWWSWKN